MRPTDATSQERQNALFKRHLDAGREAGLIRVRIEDELLDPAFITVGGKRLVNFGSCAYLGLNMDPRLREAAAQAVRSFGTVYSSSAVYTSVGLYTELEQRLQKIIGGSVIVASTTTIAHLAALPTLIGAGDAALVDNNAHASVHLATRVLASEGIPILPIKHNDLQDLEANLDRVADQYRNVWYLADGVYSMVGDVAPVRGLANLLDRYPNLHLYVDDAHGFGWKGVHGCGWVLSEMEWHPRLVLALSLAKSWGSGGSVLAFGDEDLAMRVQTVGGTLTFSGPLHPGELGASVAIADIHLSPEHEERQKAFLRQIDLVRDSLISSRIPVAGFDQTPLWLVTVGTFGRALELCSRLKERGYFTNLASFPAVPLHQSGIRFTNTLNHTDEQIAGLIDALAELVPEIAGETEIQIDLSEVEAAKSPRGAERA
jgi:7-keto-8-aminopelargonate synthetase-like enzyme